MAKHPANALINESSPYLLQHAYNPVNWLPWSNEAFKLATEENKLVIISVGYSACHWCHVMEHESFEDEQVAEVMNANYISIKVDREERPDVDNLYMTAVQLMTGQGGWPLNCIVLPDGRPIYGGTYFNKKQWLNVLTNIVDVFKNDKTKIEEYAANLTEGIKQAELVATTKYPENMEIEEAIHNGMKKWKERFDDTNGGPNKVPKFPLPNNYLYLLRYAHLYKDDAVMSHVNLTLTKMANGGIYDQLHGGFARYSTDGIWKLPHFEKMLYDNAQLVSLYAEAFRSAKNELYKQVVIETLDFIEHEWLTKEGCFYSAYDADSEGEEGKYYVWTIEELRTVLKDEYELFAEFYQVNEVGYWEHDNYILMRKEDLTDLLIKHHTTPDDLRSRIEKCKTSLKAVASGRVKPGLDDKSITSWNALMAKGFADAYSTFGIEKYKTIAISCVDFILDKQQKKSDELNRIYKNGVSKIDAFLDDYAFTIDALLAVYTISKNQTYLQKAQEFAELVIENFGNKENVLFYYTHKIHQQLITQQTETSDNVIPSSNSQMALNLFYLGKLIDKPEYIERAVKMLHLFLAEMVGYGAGYSNWGCLALFLTNPFKEVVIVGNNVDELFLKLHKHYFTNAILVLSENASDLPLLKNRWKKDETLIYICQNNTCGLPSTSVEEALKTIEKD
jgi:uncharacterized protein YyaL (SSP411 family)